MKTKRLKKLNAAFRFKIDILNKEQFKYATQAQKEELWKLYLDSLAAGRLITKYQAKSWIYPKKELNS